MQLTAQGPQVGPGEGIDDGDELITSEPSHDAVLTAPVGGAAVGHDEGGVPGGVAVGVVEGLEAVQVGNAQVRGFLDWCDGEPGRLPIVGGGSGSAFHWPLSTGPAR